MRVKRGHQRRSEGESRIWQALRAAGRPLRAEELRHILGVAQGQEGWVAEVLRDLESRGELVLLKGGRYGLTERLSLVVGELTVHPEGYGFVTPEKGGKEVFIAAGNLKEAWHGDRVVVRLEARRGRRREGRVIRILSRGVQEVLGLLRRTDDIYYVEPEDERLLFNLVIRPEGLAGAEVGEVVRARVTHYPTAHLNPQGEILEVLGQGEDAEVQTCLVIGKYGLPDKFPPAALAEAEEITAEIPAAVMEERVDLRHVPLVTIDGEDARDFDDGVAVVKKPGGHYTLYVAIADVSHYVKPGSVLDQEAYQRGTSVYFPARAVHMLPERLATGICSLNPGEDRLAVCVILDYDRAGRLRGSSFVRAVVRNRARLTYRLVQSLLAGKERRLREQYRPFLKVLTRMAELCRLLRHWRGVRGSLLLSLPEAEVMLDEQGWPQDICRVDHLISHQMIEEFMIAANEAVAVYLGESCLYRVHERPDAAKMEGFREFVEGLGMELPKGAWREPKVLKGFLEEVSQTPVAAMVQMMLLRSLKQARYAEVNVGHYGLAAPIYTHFTSPIRRYPDLLVHRLLVARLTGRPLSIGHEAEELAEKARYLSQRERRAVEAEREMLARMQVRCLARRVGETFSGRISGVTTFGFFVSLDDIYADGLVRLVDLPDDYYRLEEARQRLVGRRRRRIFQLGDQVRVKVDGVDIRRRHINFVLAEE